MAGVHVMTIDLEDWFHCLEPEPDRWAVFSRRAEVGTRLLLSLLAKAGARATFFVLGDVARHHPDLVREVAAAGHEIGTHGMEHRFIRAQGPKAFRSDLRQSLELLGDLSGQPVRAYRAPCFSVTSETLWALDVLVEEGISTDSSIFPVRNPRYGIPNAPRLPHEIRAGLWEWPVSTLPTPLGNLPFAGGVYLRFLPRSWLRAALAHLDRRGEPVVVYLHPWEVDPEQPRYHGCSRGLRFRHYYGLHRTAAKLAEVLRMHPYTSLFQAMEAGKPGPLR